MRLLFDSQTPRTEVRVSPVMPQDKNPLAPGGFPEEQVIRKRPEVGTPQINSNGVKVLGVPFYACDQFFQFLVGNCSGLTDPLGALRE